MVYRARWFQALCLAWLLPGVVFAQNAAQKPEPPTPAPVRAASAPSSTPADAATQQQWQRYKLQKDDSLMIEFPFTPEYNSTVKVQPDGFISPKGVKSVKAEGLTTPEVQKELMEEYSKILDKPVITLALQNFVQPYFIVYGQVNKPGKYVLYGDVTASQALGIAGGYSKSAKHSEVYLFRRVSNDWVSAQKLNLKDMLTSGNLAQDPHLQSGDMVWVPKSGLAKVLSLEPLISWNRFQLNYGPGFY